MDGWIDWWMGGWMDGWVVVNDLTHNLQPISVTHLNTL